MLPYYVLVWLFHVLFVAPLLIYIWYMNQVRKQQIPKVIWNIILVLGVGALCYHGYKAGRWFIINA